MHHSHSLQFHSTVTPLGVYSGFPPAGLWLQHCGCTRLTSSGEIWSSLNCHSCPKQQTATVFSISASQWMRWGLSGADFFHKAVPPTLSLNHLYPPPSHGIDLATRICSALSLSTFSLMKWFQTVHILGWMNFRHRTMVTLTKHF